MKSILISTKTNNKWCSFRTGGHTYENFDKISKCLGMCLDLTIAFDTVNHGKIWKDWISKKLIEIFLINHQKRVTINNTTSSYITTNSGVSQGTILGSHLFIIYNNDIINSTKQGKYLVPTICLKLSVLLLNIVQSNTKTFLKNVVNLFNLILWVSLGSDLLLWL